MRKVSSISWVSQLVPLPPGWPNITPFEPVQVRTAAWGGATASRAGVARRPGSPPAANVGIASKLGIVLETLRQLAPGLLAGHRQKKTSHDGEVDETEGVNRRPPDGATPAWGFSSKRKPWRP